MTIKQTIRCIAFVLVVCCMLVLFCDLFELDNTTNFDKRAASFRQLNEDTVDVVWLGTSGVDRYWISPKAYDEYGMTVYNLASDAMPAWLFVSRIKEIYTYQNPQLIIIDSRAFGQNNTDAGTMEVRARRVLDAMDFLSWNRIETAFKTMEVIHDAHPEEESFKISLLLPFIKYHTKWAEDDYSFEDNLGNRLHAYGGFWMNATKSIKAEKQKVKVYDTTIYEDLDPTSEKALYELLDYAEEKGINLLFVDTPQYKTDQEVGRANTMYKILEERGIPYVNYCETDEKGNFLYGLNLDPKTDFYKGGHVNYYGAEKFTEVMAKYLDEHYDFPDRREDEAVKEQWDGIYSKIKKKIASYEKKAAEKAAAAEEE